MANRQYVQKEWRLLSWWLATYHPHADIVMNERVGPPTQLPDAYTEEQVIQISSRVRNRWVDAIFIEGNTLNLVEAKLEPDPGIFSQLIHYARKLRSDPNYAQYVNWPLHLIALVYNDDPSVAAEALWYGVQWIVYQPNLANFPPVLTKGGAIATAQITLPQDWPARLRAWGIASVPGIGSG